MFIKHRKEISNQIKQQKKDFNNLADNFENNVDRIISSQEEINFESAIKEVSKYKNY